MTPDLMEEGARRLEAHEHPPEAGKTASGGREAGFSRHATPGEIDVTHGRILYLEDVSVSFDGFKAINKLSLDIAPGELRCVIGPNGAGKTTMMDIITGKTRPDEGTVFFGSTIDLSDSVTRQAGNLSHGQKQWLEIGMLLMQDPKLLLLDEPVAGMTDEETARTAELFLSLKGKHSLMVVEHDMSFIRTISDIVTVLCDGSVLAQGTLDQVQADERVIEVYLGR